MNANTTSEWMSPNVEANRDYGWLAGYCRAHGIDMPTRQEAEQAVAARHGGDWQGYARSLRPRDLFPPRRVLRRPAPTPPAPIEMDSPAGPSTPGAGLAAGPVELFTPEQEQGPAPSHSQPVAPVG